MNRLGGCGFALVSCLLVHSAVGCGETHVDSGTGKRELQFLEECTGSCAAGLTCVCGVCTKECSSSSECGGLDARAECVPACAEETQVAQVATCGVRCSGDADCRSLGADFGCAGGLCRELAVEGAAGEGGGGGTGGGAGASGKGGSGGASASGGSENAGAGNAAGSGEAGGAGEGGTDGSGGTPGASGGGQVGLVPGSSSYWQFGTPSLDSGVAVAVDASGNVYVAGSTNGDLGGANAGLSDGFARKYEPDGTPSWTQQFGTASDDRINAAAVDASGNLYVAGQTDGSLDGTSAGKSDCFVRKYDSEGTHEWTRQFGSAGIDTANGIAVDASGNVYATGFLRTGPADTDNADAFVRKYDASGVHEWTQHFGNSANEVGYAIALDASGYLYVAGQTSGALDGIANGNTDGFVRKHAPSGAHEWTRQFGTPATDLANTLAVDASGNAYIAGQTDGDLGGEVQGTWDSFVQKYDSAGTYQWTQQLGTADSEGAQGIAVHASGSVYVAGFTATPPDRGDQQDALVVRYAADGTPRWTLPFGSSGSDLAHDIAVDADGNVFAVGYTEGALDEPNAGVLDVFVMRIDGG
jgi:hypothetical protein